MKTSVHTKISTGIFIAAILVRAEATIIQCGSKGYLIDKTVAYPLDGIFCSKQELLIYKTNPNSTLLSKRSQFEKATYCMASILMTVSENKIER